MSRAAIIGCVLAGAVGGARAETATGEWSVLAYLSGDGSLEPTALAYLRRLAAVPPTSQVHIVAQIDRSPGWSEEPGSFTDARRVVLRSVEGEVGRRWSWDVWRGEVNMGAPEVLADFLAWGAREAPARRRLVLIVGHGSGVRPLAGESRGRDGGVAYDATSNGDSLTPREIREALERLSRDSAGGAVEVVALDSCFSASAEMAGELQPVAAYLTGTPDLLYEPGVPWDRVLRTLCATPDMPSEALVQAIVGEVRAGQEQTEQPRGSYCAARLADMPGLVGSLRELLAVLQADLRDSSAEVTLARAQAARAGLSGEMIDLGGFLSALEQSAAESGEARVAGLAHAARARLEQMLVAAYSGQDGDGSPRTWSAFLPPNLSRFPADYMETGTFAVESGWGAFVKAYLDHLQERLEPPVPPGGAAG